MALTETKQKSQRPFCFVIMAFGGNPTLQDHYELAIRPTVEAFDIDCIRVDELDYNGKITEKIIGLIQNAHFIIADLTEERPNCYYELGYAHALNKAVIHTVNKESPIHFDVKDYNFIVYTRVQELSERLKKRIEATLAGQPRGSLDGIVVAIDRFESFSKSHKDRMLKDRITEHPVQSYSEKDGLPAPLNQSFQFHVKDGLQMWGNDVKFQKDDGGFYRMHEKKRGWGHTSQVAEFEGLVRSGEDIDALIRAIEKAYEVFKQKIEGA
jgi:hypothetical protein